MTVIYKYLFALLLITLISPSVKAGTYLAFSPAQVKIKTDYGFTKPTVADLRLGYEYEIHKVELAVMSAVSDDSLNQLVTDIPSSTSLFYRYNLNPKGFLSIDFILGYSQIDIESSYVGVDKFTETYEGASFGLGLEESFKSIPKLKFKVDFIQLYRGDKLKINSFSIGLRYAF